MQMFFGRALHNLRLGNPVRYLSQAIIFSNNSFPIAVWFLDLRGSPNRQSPKFLKNHFPGYLCHAQIKTKLESCLRDNSFWKPENVSRVY